jgi:hypothetical protein
VVVSFSAPSHRHFLRSQWKFRDQRELPLSLRYQGEVEEPANVEWRAGRKGWRLRNLKPGSSHCLTPSGRMLPRPLELQQKRPCPMVHLLFLEGGFQEEQDGASAATELSAALVPTEWVPVSSRTFRASGR